MRDKVQVVIGVFLGTNEKRHGGNSYKKKIGKLLRKYQVGGTLSELVSSKSWKVPIIKQVNDEVYEVQSVSVVKEPFSGCNIVVTVLPKSPDSVLGAKRKKPVTVGGVPKIDSQTKGKTMATLRRQGR